MRETIFAPATAQGRAAVAIVRISGAGARAALTALIGPRLPPARAARMRKVRGPDGAAVDRALVLWFPAPASYTGEDVAELHLHGGAAVVGGVTRALLALGLRLAEPGEFTRRAFEAGRMSLDEAEGVADLVDAETEAQARQALAQLEGALGDRHRAWRGVLTEALAMLEAAVDFPEEEVPADVARRARPSIEALAAELAQALADARRGERIREGYRIALIGAPNAGKSRLFNALIGREATIVTATPGTTRDVVEASLALGGYKALLADMAGVRDAADAIEAEGVKRARDWAQRADLRIWVVDGAAGEGAWREARELVRRGDILALNKSDMPAQEDAAGASRHAACLGAEPLELSASTGRGVEALAAKIEARMAADLSGADFPAVTRERHERLLVEALAHLGRAGEHLEAPELAAEDLRLSARALQRIAGRIGTEDVLDVVFSSFCIGK